MIEAVPVKFIHNKELPTLDNFKPLPNLHPNAKIAAYIAAQQKKMIAFARKNPFHNLLLTGDNGVGKSHIGYALYLNAYYSGRMVYAGTIAELLSEYRRYAGKESDGKGGKFIPSVLPEQLRKDAPKWTLLLDEFDKPSVTEFTAEMTFELLNAAQNYGHQVIAISNEKTLGLIEIWGKQDERSGRSIVKRLSEKAALLEIFFEDALAKKEE